MGPSALRLQAILLLPPLFSLLLGHCLIASADARFFWLRSPRLLSLATVRDITSEREAVGLIGYISMTMAIAPMLGPMLGGVLDTAFSWRANFYFFAAFGSVLLVICWLDLGETKPARPEQTCASPVSVRTLVREPLFWAYSLCTTFSTGAFYIFLTGAPLVAVSEFGVNTAQLGFYIGTITAGFMLGNFLSGRFAQNLSHLQ